MDYFIGMRRITIHCILSGAMCFVGAHSLNAEGFEGAEVSIKCSHEMAETNDKYFCRDPCKDDSLILLRVRSGGQTVNGRVSLKDSAEGTFTVTFTKLQMSDTGSYWCGVDRVLWDTYHGVHLIVIPVTTTPTTAVTSLLPITYTIQSLPMTISLAPAASTTLNKPGTAVVHSSAMHAVVGTVVMVAAVGLVLVICIRRQRGNRKPLAASDSKRPASTAVREDDYDYEEIQNEDQQRCKIAATVYSTVSPCHSTPASTASQTKVSTSFDDNVYANGGEIENDRYTSVDHHLKNPPSFPITFSTLDPAIGAKICCAGEQLKYHVPVKRSATRQYKGLCYVPTHNSKPSQDVTQSKPGSVWFGLNLK